MHYNPLSPIDRIEKSHILTNRIIVKALQSERGDLIREMNDVDLKMMMASVFRAVYNKLAVEAQRAYEFNCDNYAKEQGHVVNDPTVKFGLILDIGFEEDVSVHFDIDIEEEVTAYFEIDGKLQYREVAIESIGDLE
jgi:hypothetical protein